MKKNEASKLVVSEIHISNVLGIRKREIVPGRITTFTGKNGTGKTSPMAAIQAALGGGNLVKMRNVNAPDDEESEVVLVLEGPGSESYRLEKKGNKTVRVRARVGDTQAFEDVPRPAEWVLSLYDRVSANPLTYLNAKDTERAKLLLEALPLEMDREELRLILGPDEKHVPTLPPGLHPLKELELIADGVYRARTGVNVNARGKADAADQTRRKLPATIPDNPQAVIDALDRETTALGEALARRETGDEATAKAAIEAAGSTYTLEEQRISAEFKVEAAKLRKAHEEQAAEIKAEAERRIAKLKAEVDSTVEALNGSAIEQIDAEERKKDEALVLARGTRETARKETDEAKRDVATKRERLATLRAQAQESAAARALQELADQYEQDARDLGIEGKRMTATLEALSAFGRRLSSSLPIPGLTIEGDSIRVDGVLFEQLNLARRIDIACKVACLRAKENRLPLLFVDEAQSLDAEHLAELHACLLREGVQAWIARVTDDEPATETIGEAVVA